MRSVAADRAVGFAYSAGVSSCSSPNAREDALFECRAARSTRTHGLGTGVALTGRLLTCGYDGVPPTARVVGGRVVGKKGAQHKSAMQIVST